MKFIKGFLSNFFFLILSQSYRFPTMWCNTQARVGKGANTRTHAQTRALVSWAESSPTEDRVTDELHTRLYCFAFEAEERYFTYKCFFIVCLSLPGPKPTVWLSPFLLFPTSGLQQGQRADPICYRKDILGDAEVLLVRKCFAAVPFR